jgi:hypothetical protein
MAIGILRSACAVIINQAAWAFLKSHRLDADPKYKPYVITR